MKIRGVGLALVMSSAVGVWACTTNNPTRPSMSFVAPTAQQPSNGTTFNFNQQPITLRIANVVRTGGTSVTYTLEVATNNSFATTAVTREGIAEGSDGSTSVVLPQLNGGTTYFWRSRAVVDGVAGEPSATQSFLVRPNITLAVPTLKEPAQGSDVFAARPTFVITNAARTGPAGTISYDFQVSSSAAFGSLTASATVTEQSGSTSWTPTTDLPEGPLFWRVRAKDVANDIIGSFSGGAQFVRRFGVDLNKAVIAFGPGHVATWPQTARLYDVYFDPADTEILCTFYDDPGWPGTLFFDDPAGAQVQANQWVFVLRQGVWYAGVAAWMRPGQACKRDYDQAFFIESLGNKFPFTETVLHSGDIIGVMVTTPARAWPSMSTKDERSNIMMVAWPPGR